MGKRKKGKGFLLVRKMGLFLFSTITVYSKTRENDMYTWNKIVYAARNEISKASAPLSLVKRWGVPLWVLSSSLDITKYRESNDWRDLVNTFVGNPGVGFRGSALVSGKTIYEEYSHANNFR